MSTPTTVKEVGKALLAKWPDIAGGLIGAFFKWAAVGATFHLGWNLVH